ncbi:MAG TPA: tRNA (adenosine(37)-N6)-threonylcarbamoyltransferase complex dimerization subunit type 1 TsaB [Candidatus Eisenbacteria bacterium]|nr:tRNA (adenosine(37)-N6)-threonylcarbamoyltransferase complex dimerization subunit type 1 TsaB [Candidatus Eisenbacteria bacterium]
MRSILGIDTASPRGSLALLVDGAPRGTAALSRGEHSSGLATAAARLMADAGLGAGLASLGGLAVSRGPGSFTGLRIGLAWAKGIAVGAGVPLVLVSAHEAAAHAAAVAGARAGDLLVTVTPGERKQVEFALWEAPAAARSRPRPLQPPESIPEDDLTDRLLALSSSGGAWAGRTFRAIPANDAIAALLDEEDIPRTPVLDLAESVAAVGDLLLQSGESSDVVLAAPSYGRAPNARKPPA